jgi:2-dehydro-3-deoxyphosphogluconate aldolase / (4S)-4-hydroxy-2-oxoglutarate aldolase
MSSLSIEQVAERMYRTGVVAVLVVDRTADAIPLANALLAGGIDIMELTLRTPVAVDALRKIKAEVPQMLAGIGTILTTAQVAEVVAAGAAFGVSPGMNRRVVEAAQAAGLPFAPGIATPSEIEQALECGCRLLKFFPAEPSGGLAYLKAIAAPYAHLKVRYLPLGGLDANSVERYISEPLVHAMGGSWIAPRELIQKQDWSAITERAQQATQKIKAIRQGATA